MARGALNVLRASASETPTLVAIDDVQWLDTPSLDVLRFLVHRLGDERLGLLASLRNGEATSLELDRAFPGGALLRLRLESLSLEELEEVVRLHVPTAIEALLGAGELVHAESLTERLEAHASAMPVPSAIAAAARCRALVLAHGGDVEGARASIDAALGAHARLDEPFEIARTYLAQGSIERRAKLKAEARASLGRAEAIFGELGARLWLERVHGELARTGLTRSLGRDLTPTELRVAELAAAGSRNKEIAGALFVSVKTVEANLSRVYAKLGIRSRVELAARLAVRGQREAGPAARP